MLVLSRKINERIRVELPDGRFGWVTVVRIDRNKVRIGFDLPRDCALMREEIVPFLHSRIRPDHAPQDGG